MDLSICCIYKEEDHGGLLGMVRSVPSDTEIVLMRTTPVTNKANHGLIEYIKDEDAGYGKLVKHFEYSYYCEDIDDCWNSDKDNHFSFSGAKNACKAQATRSTILFLAADERLSNWPEYNWERLLDISNDVGGFLVGIFSYSDPSAEQPTGGRLITPAIKMFRNIEEFEYKNDVHEQIRDSIMAAGFTIASSNILINHFGYKDIESAAIDEKLRRNLYLLNRNLQREPDNLYLLEAKLKTMRTIRNRSQKMTNVKC